MKKILFAINNLGIGGAEQLVLNQVKYINSDIFDSWLLTLLPDPPKNFSESARFLGDRLVRFNLKNIFDLNSWRKIFLFLWKEKFDVVVTGLFLPNLIVRFLAILARVPVIITCEYNIYEDKRCWQILADKFLSYFTDKIIVSSPDVLEFTSRQEKISKDKFVVNYNAIPLEELDLSQEKIEELKAKLNVPLDGLVITTAGRLIEQKGHIVLIRAIAKIKKQNPQLKFRVLIFGKGILERELLKEIKKLSLEDAICLPGIWPIRELLAVTDIFVLPSLWEGLSIALLEAMNANKSIVATEVSGSREVILNGQNGFLVAPKDADSLAEKLEILLKNKELRIQMGLQAKKYVQRFSIENNVALLENLMSSIFLNKLKSYEI